MMSDTEKIKLIQQLITDFWGFSSDDEVKQGAITLVTAIHSIIDFGDDENV
jgi:hypothetical protein